MNYTAARYIPKGAAKVANKSGSAVAYLYRTSRGSLAAIGYRGKAGKPAINFIYGNEARRAEMVAKFLRDADATLQAKAKRAADKREALAQPHDVKVGEVFVSSWGWEQTNIDYYQVTELKGRRGVVIRKIAGMVEDTGHMEGVSVPHKGNFKGEPMLKKLDERNVIRITSFANAHRMVPKIIAGVTVYEASRWSAYA